MYIPDRTGVVSMDNSTSVAMSASGAWTGSFEDVSGFSSMLIACKTDQDGVLTLEFSPDAINIDSSLNFDVASGVNEIHRFSVTRQWARLKYYNSSASSQSYFRLQTILGQQNIVTSNLNSTIQSDADAIVTRGVLTGKTTGGQYVNTPVTAEGHLEVALHSPRLPFGSIHVENLYPVFQTDSVYGINPQQVITTSGSAFGTGSFSSTVTGSNNLFKCSTGETAFSFASLQSRRRLRYRPGQGVVGRFAGFFSASVANSIVVAGIGTSESGYYFGYNGTQFGILHSDGGKRAIQTMTITTPSTATNNYVITLPNNTTSSISATNNGSATRTAYEIATGIFQGWKAMASGNTVVFLANSVGAVSGSFSLSQPSAGSPATGTTIITVSGSSNTDTWYYQTAWNGDKLDGAGASGITLDPSKGNVYQIGIQYLGFGSISFDVEVCPDDSNNPEFVTVHTIKFPNTRTSVTAVQPAFPFLMSAYSAGSTTDVSVNVGSFAGFIEGNRIPIGPRQTYFNPSSVTSTTSGYTPIFTIKNGFVYKQRANQAVSHVINVGGAVKSNTGLTTYYLIGSATLSGPTNFIQWAPTSTTFVDTGSTACTFNTNDQIIWSGTISETGDFNYAFADEEITLQPGESITLAVRSVTSTAVCIGSLNTREDQ